jgi:hypothetical protein
MKQEILKKLLDPKDGLDPQIANQLRTALNLPAAVAEPKPATDGQPAPSAPEKPPGAGLK